MCIENKQNLKMQGSNRSGLQCLEHPNQQITNYCLHRDCLKPLCPDCVQLHTKYHQKQQIQSWKHCVNKSARNVKGTLDSLRALYDKNHQYQSVKSVDLIESQNVKRLAMIKEKVMRLVDDVFGIHQQKLRNIIRAQYRVDPPDTTKLKMAIEQLQKMLMKLGHASTVLPALKKSLLLDHQSLKNYFNSMDYKSKKSQLSQWYITETQDPLKLRTYLQDLIKINTAQYQKQFYQKQNNINYSPGLYNHSPQIVTYGTAKKEIRESRVVEHWPLQIYGNDYFGQGCVNKYLHFFIPASKELKLLNLEAMQGNNSNAGWTTVQFKAKNDVPCFFKSIITPNGQIYLTGGSTQPKKRHDEIYRYSYQRKSLQFICKMRKARSSHSICYLNQKIYMIGGFYTNQHNQGQITNQCQVYNIQKQQCQQIAPLNAPSANSCATSYNNAYILKFGGILNRVDGNNLIEMYNVRSNRWTVVDIRYGAGIQKIEFLSFSAAVQINQNSVIVFGGYDNTDLEKPEKTFFVMDIDADRSSVIIKNYNDAQLPYAQGFWNNNPIVYNRKVYAIQNVTDQNDELTAMADQRRVIVFNGDKWW